MKVVIADAAEADLEAIGDWIARDSPRPAQSFVLELRLRCGTFAQHPKQLPVVRRLGDRTIRRAVLGNYLIFVEIDELQQVVRVVPILHAAQDQETVLSREGSE